jgi:hypothetical protein
MERRSGQRCWLPRLGAKRLGWANSKMDAISPSLGKTETFQYFMEKPTR